MVVTNTISIIYLKFIFCVDDVDIAKLRSRQLIKTELKIVLILSR